MKKIQIGIIGFGNVGAGVVKILRDRRTLLADKTGSDIAIRHICDKDITSKRGVSVEKGVLTRDVREVLDDPQVDAVVELIGGIQPAKEFITEALLKGKHVVTANKALLAEHGRELFALARDKDKSIYFEASVGAGIPIIKSLREGLIANRFGRIYGIVNGTSNFVLSMMGEHNCSFADAVSQAQKKGYAEANPTLDIEGIDSAHKLVLLAYLGFGRWAGMHELFIEGISNISLADVNYARELGFEIKLLAIAKKEEGELELRVHPTFVPQRHMLASVGGVFNAIYVNSDLAGDLMFYGPGAGQLCAASGVVSDLMDLAQDLKAGMFRPVIRAVPDISITRLRKIDEIESRYYVRLMVYDKPGVLARIAGIFSKHDISIALVNQKERKAQEVVPIVLVLHEAKEKHLRASLQALSKLDVVKHKPVAIRIEQL
jgi:homoserine dehydrogenase